MFEGREGDSKTAFLYRNDNEIAEATMSFEIATGYLEDGQTKYFEKQKKQ